MNSSFGGLHATECSLGILASGARQIQNPVRIRTGSYALNVVGADYFIHAGHSTFFCDDGHGVIWPRGVTADEQT
ncbi:MAG: hypothetical protein JF598_11300 [Streptomyces sp.]|nr:hypothetical protein [Streptomyces sp.]